MQVATVTIINPKAPDRPLIINASEFDAGQHVLWADRETTRQPTVDEQRAKFIAEQLSLKADEVIEKVQQAPVDALDVLKAMKDAEAAGKKRSTVLTAIDAQIAKLTAPATT